MTSSEAGPDPSRHVLVWQDVERQPDGTRTSRPIKLDEAAARYASAIEVGRQAEMLLDPEDESDTVAFSTSRGHIIAVMLDELARRLEPGRAVGQIQSDGSYSRLAHDLAWHLRYGTGY